MQNKLLLPGITITIASKKHSDQQSKIMDWAVSQESRESVLMLIEIGASLSEASVLRAIKGES